MGYRRVPLRDEEVYHVYSRSIAEYIIFRTDNDFRRFIETLYYYTAEKPPYKFSVYARLLAEARQKTMDQIDASSKTVQLIGFCIMPTHIHLILKQYQKDGISGYIEQVLKSYSKYFNKKYNRHGPLFESRFKNVHVETSEQFLHLTRYVHLNPVSISLVKDPIDWDYSSYKQYLGILPEEDAICDFGGYFEMSEQAYKDFVLERADYQKELQGIKHLLLE